MRFCLVCGRKWTNYCEVFNLSNFTHVGLCIAEYCTFCESLRAQINCAATEQYTCSLFEEIITPVRSHSTAEEPFQLDSAAFCFALAEEHVVYVGRGRASSWPAARVPAHRRNLRVQCR